MSGVWLSDDSVAFTIQREPTEIRCLLLASRDLRSARPPCGFRTGATTPSTGRLARLSSRATADDPSPIGPRRITFTVIPGGFTRPTIVSPATPIAVDEATRLTTVGEDGYFVTLDRGRSGGAYTVTALVPVPGNGEGQLNRDALLAAGTTYPPRSGDVHDSPAGHVGAEPRAPRQKILGAAKYPAPRSTSPRRSLRSCDPRLPVHHRHEGRAVRGLSTVECFATVRRGFCQWYAMTMAVVLRDVGIPARIVAGFLPGERSGTEEVIRNTNAHIGSRSTSRATAGSPSIRPVASRP